MSMSEYHVLSCVRRHHTPARAPCPRSSATGFKAPLRPDAHAKTKGPDASLRQAPSHYGWLSTSKSARCTSTTKP